MTVVEFIPKEPPIYEIWRCEDFPGKNDWQFIRWLRANEVSKIYPLHKLFYSKSRNEFGLA